MALGYALAGAIGGAGDWMMKEAERAKEQAERERRERREERLTAEDRAYRETWRDEGRAHEKSQAAAQATAETNVYRSLFGTESGGNFSAQNGEGYTGRSQFGEARLSDFTRAHGLGRITMDQFRNDPALQQKVEEWHFQDINNFIDKNDLTRFEGQKINGVPITRSGIIAMAHLGGAGGAKKFLETGGQYNPKDSNGTHLSDYARTHGGKDTSMEGIWAALEDPNVSPATRAAAVKEIDARKNPKPIKLTGEEWVERDGKEVLMGRDDKGTMRPYKDTDGKPISRTKTTKAKRPVELTSGQTEEVDEWAEREGLSYDVALNFKVKVQKFMQGGMAFHNALKSALGVAEQAEDQIVESGGLTIGGRQIIKPQKKVVPGGYTGEFREPGGLGPAPGREAQKTPDMPKEPELPAAGGEDRQSVLDEARKAIERGAPRDKVVARLREFGINPDLL